MTKSQNPPRDILVAHSSDVHVDHEYTARLFGGDGTGGLRAVLEAAQGAGADVVLLAGDTFESHRLPVQLIEATAALLRDYSLEIVLLPGNHDPAVEDAVFHHPALAATPNLHVIGITHDELVTLPDLGLEIWGRAHRHYGDMDPLADPAPRGATRRIVMAHGHYTPAPDRSTRRRPSWLLGDEEIAAAGADYVALGHWNRHVRVGPAESHAWYSGSPEYARSINLVRLPAAGRALVERRPLVLPEGFGEGIY